jgi:hypothetical protein
MRAITLFIRIADLNSLLHLMRCNGLLPKDLETHTYDLKPLSCILANIKLSSLVQPCRSPTLIPGVATKVKSAIAAPAAPVLKEKKLSNSPVSQIRQHMGEKAIERIQHRTWFVNTNIKRLLHILTDSGYDLFG